MRWDGMKEQVPRVHEYAVCLSFGTPFAEFGLKMSNAEHDVR